LTRRTASSPQHAYDTQSHQRGLPHYARSPRTGAHDPHPRWASCRVEPAPHRRVGGHPAGM